MREEMPQMDEINCATGVRARRLSACCAAAAALVATFALGHAHAASPAGDASIKQASSASAEVVFRALALLGVRYRFGGNTPELGLDCSGLVKLVFQETVGMVLPRRSDDMSRYGQAIPMPDLQPGDLVYFNTMRLPFSHVGIYIGDRRFVHAPSSGGVVRVESMDLDYWMKRFDGARRLLDSSAPQTERLVLEAVSGTGAAGSPQSSALAEDRYPPGN